MDLEEPKITNYLKSYDFPEDMLNSINSFINYVCLYLENNTLNYESNLSVRRNINFNEYSMFKLLFDYIKNINIMSISQLDTILDKYYYNLSKYNKKCIEMVESYRINKIDYNILCDFFGYNSNNNISIYHKKNYRTLYGKLCNVDKFMKKINNNSNNTKEFYYFGLFYKYTFFEKYLMFLLEEC